MPRKAQGNCLARFLSSLTAHSCFVGEIQRRPRQATDNVEEERCKMLEARLQGRRSTFGVPQNRGPQGCNPQDSEGILIGHPLRAEGSATEMWVNVSLPPLLLSPSFTQKVRTSQDKFPWTGRTESPGSPAFKEARKWLPFGFAGGAENGAGRMEEAGSSPHDRLRQRQRQRRRRRRGAWWWLLCSAPQWPDSPKLEGW